MPTDKKGNYWWVVKSKPKAKVGQGRANPNRSLYGSWKWTRASLRYRNNNPLCVLCKQNGKYVQSQVVDHKIPVNSGNVDPYDESNWQALCRPCHAKKSSNEGRDSIGKDA